MIIGSGVAISEQRDLPPFNSIDVNGSFKVTAVCQASTQTVEVIGHDQARVTCRTVSVRKLSRPKPGFAGG